MRVVNGIAVGAILALVGTVLYLHFFLYRGLPPHTSTGLDGIEQVTIAKPWYWAGVAAAFLLGFVVSRPKRPAK